MIRLKSLKMKAFRSFAEEVHIDFPQNGLVLIRGENSGTHDSSGAGKSTVLLAISYALDMCPFPASELQSWYTEDYMQVQLVLETTNGDVVIHRGKRNSLKVGDRDSITGAKAIAEGIRQLFALDIDTLQAITYRAQNTSGLFLKLTDSEKKEFLTRILGLEAIERAVEIAEKQIKLLAPALELKEQSITQCEVGLKSLLELLGSFSSPQNCTDFYIELEACQTELSQIDSRVKEAWDKANQKKEEAAGNPEYIKALALLEAATAQRQNSIKANAERHQDFQNRQEGLRKKLQDVTRQEATRVTLVQNIATLQQQLEQTLQGRCSMCSRTWDQALKKAEEFKAIIANYEAQLRSLGDSTAERKKIEESLRELFIIDPIIERLQYIQGQLETQCMELKTELTMGPINEAQETYNFYNVQRGMLTTRIKGLREQISYVESVNKKLEASQAIVKKDVQMYEGNLAVYRNEIDGLRKELNAEKDFLALMGKDGFLGVIFDDVLREIEIEANARLARLANVSHVTLHFKSEVVTQKGVVNKTITPIVNINGTDAKLKSGLSGGMYTSVEGVIDLAVMSVVQRRTGTLPGFLFLDESFNGQGKATKESAMEILREYGQEKLVIVIDHNSELQEMFTQFIDINCNNGISRIK